MRVRKIAVSLVACCLGLMFLTAVAAAVPADRSLTMKTAQAAPVVMVKASAFSMNGASQRHTLLSTFSAFAPSAEPVTLLLFGTALIGAARMARRKPADQQ